MQQQPQHEIRIVGEEEYSEDEQTSLRLAYAALHYAFDRDWGKAAEAIKAISDLECMALGMIAWCDYYADHATGGLINILKGRGIEVNVDVSMVNTTTGHLDKGIGSSAAPPEVKWAARLIQARLAMDQNAWEDTVRQLPEEGIEVGVHVMALLRTVTQTCAGLPRGFGMMGHLSK